MPKSVPVTLTKILTPRPSTAVARPRLEDHAQALCDFALTTLTGGAGFGKTTILRVWAESCRADAAWVTLDEADCDVRSFAAYLDAAFRQAIPEFGRSVLDLLSEGRVEAEAFARAFANELLTASEERERDIVLFLDDFHTVQMHQGVRETVAGLLRTLPPRAVLQAEPRDLLVVRAQHVVFAGSHSSFACRVRRFGLSLLESGPQHLSASCGQNSEKCERSRPYVDLGSAQGYGRGA